MPPLSLPPSGLCLAPAVAEDREGLEQKSPLAQEGAPPAPGTPWHPQQSVSLTCSSSSSFTRDQLLMKLSFSRARMGELSRTVSRRVRPEPGTGRGTGGFAVVSSGHCHHDATC